MRGFRVAGRLALVAFVAAFVASGFGTGCGDSGLFFSTPISDVSAVPGQTVSLLVKNQIKSDGCSNTDNKVVDAAPVDWSVDGPAPSHVVSSGGGSGTWTAPDTPGIYHIQAGSMNDGSATLRVTVAAKGAPEEMSQDRSASPTSEPVKILEIGNVLGIRKGGKAPSFTLDKPAAITNITTYHYIDGGGPVPGTLSLRSADGTTYGPWQATGVDGQGGVKNAFWVATPMESIPAGKYTVVDSSPGTWSTNAKAGGVGFTTIWVAYE